MAFHWSLEDDDVGAGFFRIAREQIARAMAGAENGQEPAERRIHEARRRCKKLRALFRIVRPDFSAWQSENAFVRDAARGLSQARDLQVARNTLAELMDRPQDAAASGPDDPAAPATQEEALRRFAGRMRELQARTTSWKVEDIGLETLSKGLKQTYRTARRNRRIAERRGTDEAFHDWRKFAKYHWNQLGLLEQCAPDVLPPARHAAGELAEMLGLHHDLAILEAMLASGADDLAAGLDQGLVAGAIARRRAELEDRIRNLGQQVFAERPKALKARFDAYLANWTEAEKAG